MVFPQLTPAPVIYLVEPFGGSVRRQNPNMPHVFWDDAAVTRGDGIFESLLVRGGKAANLQRHAQRFCDSARTMNLPEPPMDKWEEATRLAIAVGGHPETMAGLAGLGDLVATCASPLSRNRTFGERLGKGETLEQAQEATGGQVAEGVKSCSSIRELADERGVDMPLTDAMHRLCHDGRSPRQVGAELLGRAKKPEWD